jgi:hypothetical protein
LFSADLQQLEIQMPTKQKPEFILFVLMLCLLGYSYLPQQTNKPDTPDVPPPVVSNLDLQVKQIFGENKKDAFGYATFYDALATSLEKGPYTHIQIRQAAELAIKQAGFKTGYLSDLLKKEFEAFAPLTAENQWTPELKKAHIDKWRELSSACLKASK